MTRTHQIAVAIGVIHGQTADGETSVLIGDEVIRIRIDTSGWGGHEWASIHINGKACGNRYGGVRHLMIALGEADDDNFAWRHAYELREELRTRGTVELGPCADLETPLTIAS